MDELRRIPQSVSRGPGRGEGRLRLARFALGQAKRQSGDARQHGVSGSAGDTELARIPI
jgi:hypothetical protein